jgi:hypothetical protein
MAKDMLLEIWDKDRKEPKMTRAEIENVLRPQYLKSASRWGFALWTYLAIIAVTLVCQGMSIYAFRTNPLMLAVGIALALLTLGFLGYGIHVLRAWSEIDLVDECLVAKLTRRLRFYRTKCELWLWMIALTPVFLGFAVNTAVDVRDGQYHINNPLVFVGIMLLQLLLVYAGLKVNQYYLVRETQALLGDLENETTTATVKVLAIRGRWRALMLILVGLLFLLLIWGIAMVLN